MKVLIIEDEAELRKSIKEYLHQEGYVVESAKDFNEGSEKAGVYTYDCIVVDITLPKGSGLDIVKQLKKAGSNSGVIIISAKNSLDDKITGLDFGADDYLTKPFHLSELNARIKSLIRRKKFDGSTVISVNEISIESEQRKVSINDNEIILTGKEYELLMYFISNKIIHGLCHLMVKIFWFTGIDIFLSGFYSLLSCLQSSMTAGKNCVLVQPISETAQIPTHHKQGHHKN